MASEATQAAVRKISGLGSGLLSVVDDGQAEGISVAEVYALIEDKGIVEYLEEKFPSVKKWALANFSTEDKRRLLGEWQSMANATLAEEDLGIRNNGISLLIAYVFEGIRMRTTSDEAWPGPEPW